MFISWKYKLIGTFSLLLTLLLTACGDAQSVPASSSTPPTTVRSGGVSQVPGLTAPAGFQMSVYATGLHSPRFLAIGPHGVLLVADRGSGSIIALPSGSAPDRAGPTQIVVDHLNDPTSLVWENGMLYVGEGSSIARMTLGDDLHAGPVQRIITDLPLGGQHSTRTVLLGPDHHIYVSIGSDCNVCNESDPHRAAIWIYDMDGSHGRLFAKGLRNAVGLATNPWTHEIWADVNGRDNLGDDIPPETVYRLVDHGDYGWPRCHAGTISDPQYGQAANACQGVEQPLVKMQAHSAPLGMAFYPPTATSFPEAYRNSLYIAFHGSWNRSTPTGYKLVRIPLHNGQVAGPAEDFVTGWLQSDGGLSGRPVGLAFAADGSLFVSDDSRGVIYHVWARNS